MTETAVKVLLLCILGIVCVLLTFMSFIAQCVYRLKAEELAAHLEAERLGFTKS